MSGRRSSKADGRPAGISGGAGLLQQGGIALDGAGVAAQKHIDLVFLEHNLAFHFGNVGGNGPKQPLGV